MIVTKLLEKKWIIRLFGAALLVSPIFNTLMTMSLLAESDKKWTWAMFNKILSIESPAILLLYFCGVLISLVMLTGSKAAWKFVLVLLGGHILHQMMNLGQSIRSNWASGLFFVINVSLFLFIADQLVWKQKAQKNSSPLKPQPPVPTPEPLPPSKPKQQLAKPSLQSTSKKVLIHFQGFGPWAQLLSISSQGIHVRELSHPPFDLSSREIEIQMKGGPTLRTKLSHQTNQDFFFKYTRLSPNQVQQLNQWLKQKAA